MRLKLILLKIFVLCLLCPGQVQAAKATSPIKAPQGKVTVLINTQNRTLTVLNDNLPYKQFKVAVGKPETPTPLGNWQVIRKARDWGNGFGTRFMLLDVVWGLYGIHGTNKPYSIGGQESGGCIRMFNQDVETLYPWVQVGTKVIIVGNPFGALHESWKILVRGDNGADVVQVQEQLAKWGFYTGKCDGIFGYGTEKSVKEFQQKNKLPVSGQVNEAMYQALGLR